MNKLFLSISVLMFGLSIEASENQRPLRQRRESFYYSSDGTVQINVTQSILDLLAEAKLAAARAESAAKLASIAEETQEQAADDSLRYAASLFKEQE